jgi:hypothetical protein
MALGETGSPITSRGAQPYRYGPVMCGSGTFALACGLRWDRQSLACPGMKGLTFTIDPTVRWSARESVPPALLNLLPLCWTPHPNARSRPEPFHAPPRTGNPATGPHHAIFPVMRNLLQARASCATHAIRRINHSSYEPYCISTTQNGNGTWVAAFGRRDGELIGVSCAKQAVLETAPEVAEVIAIADAQIEIDDRLAAR